MFEIIKVYKQNLDSCKFIGKKYDNANRTNGDFEVKSKWIEWRENGWFEILEKQINKNLNIINKDNNAYIGLLRNKSGEPFEYYIGMFAPKNTEIPEGFEYIDFPKSELGVCWVYGNEESVSMNEGIEIFEQCQEKLEKAGLYHVHDIDDICYAFERYIRSRSKIPDERGNIILDICFFTSYYY